MPNFHEDMVCPHVGEETVLTQDNFAMYANKHRTMNNGGSSSASGSGSTTASSGVSPVKTVHVPEMA